MDPSSVIIEKQLPRSFWVGMILISFYTIIMLQMPLINYVGYEFSIAVSLFLPWIIGPVTIGVFRSVDRSKETFGGVLFTAVRTGFWLWIVPLVLGVLNVFIVRNCSLWEGIAFYFLIPGITLLLLIVLAAFCALYFRHSITWYVISIFVILGYSLFLGYATPQIYSYNLVYGFFPGFSYDELITITPTLLLFRFVTVIVAVVIMLFASFKWFSLVGTTASRSFVRWRWFPLTAIFLMIICASWIFRVEMGFETSVSYIRKVLNAHLTTPHFHIWYKKESFSEDDVWRIAAEHEFYYFQNARAIQVHENSPITSYIYPDEDVQYRMIGTRTTNIAKPWRREIHLSKSSWKQTLKHELVHVMAGEFGMPVIRAHYNIGLVEGLATAIDGTFGNRTLHEYAEAIFTFGFVRHPEQLIKPVGFAFHASTISYVLMGSFCRYLIDRYGILRFKELYGGGSPEKVYNRSYEELIGEWQTYLKRIAVPDSWKNHVAYYFNRPSIFAKRCARKVAQLNDAGYRALGDRDLAAAKKSFLGAVQISENTDSYGGLIRTEFSMADYDSVIQLFDLRDAHGKVGLLPLALLDGDALWVKERFREADRMYRQLLELDLSDRLNEAVAIRLLALKDTMLQKSLVPYFVADRADSVRYRFLDSLSQPAPAPLILYLKAKVSLRMKKYDMGIAFLERITHPFDIQILNGYREELLGELYFMKRQYETARMHFWLSLNDVGNQAYCDRIDEWLERSTWYSRHEDSFRIEKGE